MTCTAYRSVQQQYPRGSYLLIDQGNSRLKIATSDGTHLHPSKIYETPPSLTQLQEQLSEELGTLLADTHLLYSSVGQEQKVWLDTIRTSCQSLLVLSSETPLPLSICAYNRTEIGMDRIAAVMGAMQIEHAQILIIDIGTAVTFDLLLDQTQYAGGNIAPGPTLRLSSLADYTHRLPRVPWYRGDEAQALWALQLGHTTEQAIWLGVARSLVHEIDGYIDACRNTYGEILPILTGGYALDFVTWLKNKTFVKTNLVEQGLLEILIYNLSQSNHP